jgi:hypothetical protein
MKTKNIAFTIMLLLLCCVAFTFRAQANPPSPFHALLTTPPDPDHVAGTLETLLTSVNGTSNQFQLAGQVHLASPPDPDIPYTFGEIVRYDGVVVANIANPDIRGNETFFTIYAVISADVATQVTGNPTLFSASFYNDAGLAAQGTLQFGHALSTVGDVIP